VCQLSERSRRIGDPQLRRLTQRRRNASKSELGNCARRCFTLTCSARGGSSSVSRFTIDRPAYGILRLIERALTLQPQHRVIRPHVSEESRDSLSFLHIDERSTAPPRDADVDAKSGYEFTRCARATLAAAEKFKMVAV